MHGGRISGFFKGFSAATYHAGTAVPDSEVTTPEEAARQKRILVATINSILPKLPDFTDLLINPPPKNAMNTTAGPLDPPLGATRLSKFSTLEIK